MNDAVNNSKGKRPTAGAHEHVNQGELPTLEGHNPPITHEKFVGLNVEAARIFEEMERLKSQNVISRAIKVVDVKIREGQMRKDREGNPVFDANHQPIFWAAKHFIVAASEVGTVEIEVTEAQAKMIKAGVWYMAMGFVSIVVPYEGNRTYEAIKYTEFQDLTLYLGKGA